MLYHRLDGSQPHNPPSYDDIGEAAPSGRAASPRDSASLSRAASLDIEQFEIDDGMRRGDASGGRRWLKGARRLAACLGSTVVRPVAQMADPLCEGYRYFLAMYERGVLKVGNPLVVKRLLYVFFILGVIVAVTRYSPEEDAGHHLGGGFSLGVLFDVDKLAAAIPSMIDTKLIKENLEYFLLMPHLAGTRGDLALARYTERYMANAGIRDHSTSELLIRVNYPRAADTYLRLADGEVEATLREGAADTGGIERFAFNPNALNTNGEVLGPYLYAGFGTAADLDAVVAAVGGDNALDGAILFVKYGGALPEANKVRLATDLGAKAVVFVTPPYRDADGVHDDVISRCNVGLGRYSTGDVLTPGWLLGDGYVTRLPWFKSETTAKIPTLPVLHRDAQRFLARLRGGVKLGDTWLGTFGDNPRAVLKVTNDERAVHQIWNVAGLIEGREQPEKGLIIGAARDAMGYALGSTGAAVMLELVKIFTLLQRRYNWTPARSIYFVSFDGTEYNLAGLTEWIESRKDLLQKEGYAYLDISDVVAGGDLSVTASPLLSGVIRKALGEVRDLEHEGATLLDRLHDGGHNLIEEKNYIPFVNLLNIPAAEIRFGAAAPPPPNSCFDTFARTERADPKMHRHRMVTEALARVVLYLSETPIIPLDYVELARHVKRATAQLERRGVDTAALARAVRALEVAALRVAEWTLGWRKYIEELGGAEPTLLLLNRWKQNDRLVAFNSLFVMKSFKAPRPSYVNVLFGVPFGAPSDRREVPDGADCNVFPAVYDALAAGDLARAQREVDLLAQLTERAADDIQRL
jgi:N-acetylated-alpha-linked acidic dipeptidase